MFEQVPSAGRGLVDGVELGLLARQAGEVEFVTELAAQHRMVDGVVVVDDRMDDRNLFLHVRGREAVIVNRADVEITALAFAGEIDLRDARAGGGPERIGEMIARQTRVVVRQKRLVGQRDGVPAPGPFVVDGELARAFDAAAEIAVAGRGQAAGIGKIAAVQLIDAGAANFVSAVEQALAKFTLQQRALLGGDHGREGGVVIGRQRPIVRHFERLTVNAARGNRRHQHAGLALDGRIGRREIGQPGDRLAEKFEAGVLEIEHLLALVVNDARGLHLPERRLPRIVLARFAGGIDAVMQNGEIAAGALGAGRRHARLVGRCPDAANPRTRRDNRPTGP